MDYSQLDEISLEAERWKIKELGLDLCSTIEDPDASTVNLVRACTCTEPGDEASAKLRYIKPTPGEVLWFPPEYNEDDKTTRDKISILINDALLRQKCIVSIQGHKRKNHKRDDGATRSIIFRCFRGVTKRKSVSENQRACTSKRPPEGVEPCKFQIRVTCTTTDRHNPRTYRYFIRLTAGQCFSHSNHIRPATVFHSTRHLSMDVLHLLSGMLLKHCPISVGGTLIHEMTGKHLQPDALRQLKHKLMKGELHGSDSTNASTGEELLDLLDNSPDLDYIYFTASREMSSNLIKVRKSRKGASTTASPEADAKADLEELLDGLRIEDGTSVLVAVAWMSDQQLRYFRLFPELIGFDITYNTNAEKRAMFIVVGRTSDGKNIPILNAFFPSEAKWVFNWVFKEALPYLLGEDLIKRIRLVTTDEDPQCIAAFTSAIKEGYYPNALLRLCKWHKVSHFYDEMMFYMRITHPLLSAR